MIQADLLLSDLKKRLKLLEDDLRERCQEFPEAEGRLKAEYEAARDKQRTGLDYLTWREGELTQIAVAWLLACVFLRFMEDNRLIERPLLAGPGERRKRAAEGRTAYFRRNPTHHDRDFLLHLFHQAAELPAAAELWDERHNPLWRLGPSADGAQELVQFFQRLDEDGRIRHDFTDPQRDTRFLGDLYQDLSEATRKRYALLQTPHFVESFILDRTLTPAIDTFGFEHVRLIDPTCGSGHFLLGAFHRLYELHRRANPEQNPTYTANLALKQVYGVDLNPFAVAIARFRLIVAAMHAAGIENLTQLPAFEINLAVGDSLLHGAHFSGHTGYQQGLPEMEEGMDFTFHSEDAGILRRILGQRYHAVVGNPPYITVKDGVLNKAYRDRYKSCHRQYSLGVPFTERFFDLALSVDEGKAAGFVGLITANSFMKREFGKVLIENCLPRLDLTHIVDTSGTYIPGHGTPTVIMFGRNRASAIKIVRAVLGVRGDHCIPEDPEKGLVWSSIVSLIDHPGNGNDLVSVEDLPHSYFESHPWILSGGGKAALKTRIEERCSLTLMEICKEIGFGAVTRQDDIYLVSKCVAKRWGISSAFIRPIVSGEEIRDWNRLFPVQGIWPYESRSLKALVDKAIEKCLWPFKVQLSKRVAFGQTQVGRGLKWFEYSMFFRKRFLIPLSITFAYVATHNHFVFDRGGKVFKQSAPVIKLSKGSSEDDHLELLGVLNSSASCFWMKQVMSAKPISDPAFQIFEFDGTKLKKLPIPEKRNLELPKQIDSLATELASCLPKASLENGLSSKGDLESQRKKFLEIRKQMIALQEEIDWFYYQQYGVTSESLIFLSGQLPGVCTGQRAFEFILARKKAEGDNSITWFDRNGIKPNVEIPPHWPKAYRDLVTRRIQVIETDKNIGLIERPEFKRRWHGSSWDEMLVQALREKLLDMIEDLPIWKSAPQMRGIRELSDHLMRDAAFVNLAGLYRERNDFDPVALVAELVEEEAVPALAVLRYKDSGLRKHESWQRTWELQRQEDVITARVELPKDHPDYLDPDRLAATLTQEVGDIPVPPRYKSNDFHRTSYWRLRGKLDVPKERFVAFPHCERDDDRSLLVGWAGWNHLETARAVAAFYIQMRDQEGWPTYRLLHLVGVLHELQPWLNQWHHEYHPDYDGPPAPWFREFTDNCLRDLNATEADLTAWQPPKTTKSKRRSKA